MTPTKTPTDLTMWTPAEIDEQLSRIWQDQYAALDKIRYLRLQVEKYTEALAIKTARQPGWLQYSCYTEEGRAHCQNELDGYRAQLKALKDEAAPYEAEFTRRGGWARYFKVLNGNGHVHRSQNCTSCGPTTRYAWLYNLSGATDDKVIAEWGHAACSQPCCFPDAPVDEMRRTHEAALYCPGSGHYVPKPEGWRGAWNYRPCPHCNQIVTITKDAGLRKHKPKGSKKSA